MNRVLAMVVVMLVAPVTFAVPLQPDTTTSSPIVPEVEAKVATEIPPDVIHVDKDDEDSYVDMENADWYDEEDEERKELEKEYMEYFQSEKKRMIEDADYRDEIIRELEDDIFPELGGYRKAGVQEQGIYEIATDLLNKELATGRGGVRSKLDHQHDRNIAKRRRMQKRIKRQRDSGGRDIDILDDNHMFKSREETLSRRRRLSFLQREAVSVMRQRKTIALEADLEKKNELVAAHRQYMDDLKKRSAAYPGHRKQLLQVWDNEDGMVGLRFDPKVFFRLHDINSDDTLDVKEIQAFMMTEARDLHTIENGRVDELAVTEEASIMAETMLEEHDKDKNGLVDYRELLDFAETEGFIDDREWHALDPEEELRLALEKKTGRDTMTDEDLASFKHDPHEYAM